jgi:hypothetical protein
LTSKNRAPLVQEETFDRIAEDMEDIKANFNQPQKWKFAMLPLPYVLFSQLQCKRFASVANMSSISFSVSQMSGFCPLLCYSSRINLQA